MANTLDLDELLASGVTLDAFIEAAKTNDPLVVEQEAARMADRGLELLDAVIESDPENPRHIITIHRIGYRFER